ncbi:methyl-accepting chemotaxis protein [Azospira restricta]|uniref:MCP four helix bundle domain-containing protein n=1 Tax=Azospira restricta TaxID=404405 RepID=A0A974Y358_9RHOO|nr:methyl-accepting chemotaxis protein [Azospira restricta]QRJ63636.1 MCP four helix bundle domain-containing protein [Azospira restricta]
MTTTTKAMPAPPAGGQDIMNAINRLSIGQQLTLAFAVVVGLFVAVAAWTAFSLARVDRAAERIASVSLAKEAQIAQLADSFQQMQTAVRNNIIFTDAEVMKREQAVYLAEKKRFAEALAALRKLAADSGADAAERELLARIGSGFEAAVVPQDKAMEEAMQFLSSVAMGILQNDGGPKMQKVAAAIGEARQLVQAQSRARAADIADETGRTRAVALALAGVAGLVAAVLGVWLTASVRGPLAETVALMEKMAAGDLTGQVSGSGGREIQRVQQAAGRTARELTRLLAGMRGDAARLKSAASNLSAAAEGAGRGSRQQVEAAGAMAATLQQMSERIAHVAALGGEAHALSADAGRQAGDGAGLIRTMVGEIRAISELVSESAATVTTLGEDSEKISSITTVIRDVADQTNLLALNAAIEAARAGEAGRGFAVVADEVRKLAETTNRSAREIAEMIAAIQGGTRSMAAQMARSVERVEAGLQVACAAGDAMAAIDAGANRVIAVIDEVSSALNEQSAASREVSGRVERIAEMVGENDRATAAVADTARELDQLAGSLETGLGHFRTA